MTSRIVVFAFVVSICKVQSQPIGCLSNQQSSLSNVQPSCGCGTQSQTFQLQPANSNKVMKASPQLQIMPGQNCNLQAIPISQLSQFLSQGSNQQQCQNGCGATPRQGYQGIQVSSIPKIPTPTQKCIQPSQPSCGCSPTVISAPVSTITIPPSCSTTVIDYSLSNCLANALQMMIANDFINSAVCNNIVSPDGVIPIDASTGFDLCSFVKSLNANQIGCQTASTSNKPCQNDEPTVCDWEKLLERLRGDSCTQSPSADWSVVLDYLNNGDSRCECKPIEIEPASSGYDYSSFIDYLKQKGQTASQISSQYPVQSCSPSCGQTQSYYNQQYVPQSQSDLENSVLDALAAYFGISPSGVCSNGYPNAAEVVFPEEIPAQLICNYGYMPTSVPVVSFSVQPVGDCNSNFLVGSKCQ